MGSGDTIMVNAETLLKAFLEDLPAFTNTFLNCQGISIIGVSASTLTLILLMWRILRAHNNVSRWHMGFNLAFKGLN
jgi:hypothetical protein